MILRQYSLEKQPKKIKSIMKNIVRIYIYILKFEIDTEKRNTQKKTTKQQCRERSDLKFVNL